MHFKNAVFEILHVLCLISHTWYQKKASEYFSSGSACAYNGILHFLEHKVSMWLFEQSTMLHHLQYPTKKVKKKN